MTTLPASLPYKIERELGRGGMGVVYLARDTRLGRQVAIKTITPGGASAGGASATEGLEEHRRRVERLRREAQVLASLNHPGIAGIYDIAEHEESLFLVMEFVDGPTLQDRLEQSPRGLGAGDALRIGAEIAMATNAAHDAGVVHGDLKPANIKLTPKGGVKILDFGLARGKSKALATMGMDADDVPTVSFAAGDIDSLVAGTPGYMSPEMARGQAVDARADVFALGCILYEMLTGHRAFVGKTAGDVMAAVLLAEPDYKRLPPGLPDSVHRLLTRCVAKDPLKRPGSAAEVQQSLTRAAGLVQASGIGSAISEAPATAITTAVAVSPATAAAGAQAASPGANAAPAVAAEVDEGVEAEDVVLLGDLAPGAGAAGVRTFSQLPAEVRDALVQLVPIAGSFSAVMAGVMLSGATPGNGGAANAAGMLSRLVEMRLLTSEQNAEDGSWRYFLPAALRAHLQQRYRQGEMIAGAYQRLLRYLASWAAQIHALLSSPAQASVLNQVDREVETIAGAMAWCQATGECAEESVLVISQLREYWEVRGRVGYARTALEKGLDRGHGRLSPHAEAMGLSASGVLAYHEADMAEAVTLQRKALTMRRKQQDDLLIGESLLLLGEALVLKEPLTARNMLQEAIDVGNKLDKREFVARGCLGLSLLSLVTASVIESQRALLAIALGSSGRGGIGGGSGGASSLAGMVSPRLDAQVQEQWAYLKMLQNEAPEALRLAKDALNLRRQIEDQPGAGGVLCLMAQIHLLSKDADKAETLLNEGLTMLRTVRDKLGVMRGLCVKAHLLSLQARHADAVALWQACDRLRGEWMLPISPAERILSERWLVHSVQALGPEGFKEAVAVGAGLSWLQMNE